MDFLDAKLQRDFVMEYLRVIRKNTVKFISMSEGKNNYTAAVIKEKGDKHRIYIKGKPDDVISKCSQMVVKQSRDGSYHELVCFEPGVEY